ncbi:hypothetical protein DF035_23610 [Burkholderia contaminans]|nr:hypothetical protein DF035_23610 [Burkholderia contaminans]TCW65040.1 hypothetical protein C5O79_29705 [Burkholderia sp. SRS-25]
MIQCVLDHPYRIAIFIFGNIDFLHRQESHTNPSLSYLNRIFNAVPFRPHAVVGSKSIVYQ